MMLQQEDIAVISENFIRWYKGQKWGQSQFLCQNPRDDPYQNHILLQSHNMKDLIRMENDPLHEHCYHFLFDENWHIWLKFCFIIWGRITQNDSISVNVCSNSTKSETFYQWIEKPCYGCDILSAHSYLTHTIGWNYSSRIPDTFSFQKKCVCVVSLWKP